MHKANVRANEYFWNKFSEVTGLPSEKQKIKQNMKFMQIMMADDITPYCNYRNNKGFKDKMSREIYDQSISFAEVMALRLSYSAARKILLISMRICFT